MKPQKKVTVLPERVRGEPTPASAAVLGANHLQGIYPRYLSKEMYVVQPQFKKDELILEEGRRKTLGMISIMEILL